MKLGVNIDHVAVLREARRVNDPDVLHAMFVACQSGVDQITIHLREDRRHIQDADLHAILAHSSLPINLECSLDRAILGITAAAKPHRATLVPEKREEVTTEGGLDLVSNQSSLRYAIDLLHDHQIPISLFVDPHIETIQLASELGVEMVELHTGLFANIFAMLNSSLRASHHSLKELDLPRGKLALKLEDTIAEIAKAAKEAKRLGLEVAAGHGLNYANVHLIKNIKEIEELNIGQSIVARSIFCGLDRAIKDMLDLLK